MKKTYESEEIVLCHKAYNKNLDHCWFIRYNKHGELEERLGKSKTYHHGDMHTENAYNSIKSPLRDAFLAQYELEVINE